MDLATLVVVGAQLLSSIPVGNSPPPPTPNVTAAPAQGAAAQSAAAPSQPAAPDLHATESQLIERTNAERARHGLAPLVLDTSLLRSARHHAAWMTRHRVLRHTSARVAENIAMGQPSTGHVVQDWMRSPGHRANILNPNHRRIGVAGYRTPDGTIYWCQQFLR
jgi:uncharacterized protein YkwD